LTAPGREPVKRSLQSSQLLARSSTLVWCWFVVMDIGPILISHRFDGNYLFVAPSIDDEIPRHKKNERSDRQGTLPARRLVNANVNFLAQIGGLIFITPVPPDKAHEHRFERKNFAREPIVQTLLFRRHVCRQNTNPQ
jgi:hypothetical protein